MEQLEEAAHGTDDLVVQLHSARRDLTAAALRELEVQRELDSARVELTAARSAQRDLEELRAAAASRELEAQRELEELRPAAASRELQAQRELEAQRQKLEELRTASRELEVQRCELEEQQVRPY